ncbi:hypothetical protein CEXT_27891 [Caerostris extrusa]|uniref:Uncharacterized protein n=1 Tax=Caerostris extrusa TaxID=172846 RepID=A0AAV4XLC9_CAEEX|nr:hypothetical protein CEXT_27891 [Caerostris extrusa]
MERFIFEFGTDTKTQKMTYMSITKWAVVAGAVVVFGTRQPLALLGSWVNIGPVMEHLSPTAPAATPLTELALIRGALQHFISCNDHKSVEKGPIHRRLIASRKGARTMGTQPNQQELWTGRLIMLSKGLRNVTLSRSARFATCESLRRNGAIVRLADCFALHHLDRT